MTSARHHSDENMSIISALESRQEGQELKPSLRYIVNSKFKASLSYKGLRLKNSGDDALRSDL